MSDFIGRKPEIERLQQLLDKKRASLVTICGRRRIGKSRLIEHFGASHRILSFQGLSPRKAITKQDQLDAFARQLVQECGTEYEAFSDWSDAFYALSQQTKQGRVIILLDEISWMALEDVDLPGKLKIAWDKYFKKNAKLILFVCGSVSAWIQENIVNSTGFHGRISLNLYLRELPLSDCKYFWGAQQHKISALEKLKFLAVTGGIPKYLEELNPKWSAEENIRQLAFSESGILFNDFQQIFTDTLLRRSPIYEKIIRLLIEGPIDSKDISTKLNAAKGGSLSAALEELTMAGFISRHASWHLKTGKLSSIVQYRLSDNYLRFYLKYIEPNMDKIIAGNFSGRSLTSLPGWSTIMGLQIENLVLNNRDKIKQLLSIKPDEIIHDNPYLQRATARKAGCQIDYLIQTSHNTLYLIEIKFTQSILRKYVIDDMEEKIKRLQIPRHTSIRPVLVHLGDVHDEVLEADYFSDIINVESLLEVIN